MIDKINMVAENKLHKLPNFIDTFSREIKELVEKMELIKKNEFNLTMDLGYSMVYYALELCIEYQRKGDGTLPVNIKNSIWDQVINGVSRVYTIDDDYKSTISNIFNVKLGEPMIVDETTKFLLTLRSY